jgi:hypothetical protein
VYFLRRNFCATSVSTSGGKDAAYFRWKRPMARTYCCPRKTSSSSFSRCTMWRHVGIATVIMTAITASMTRRAAMA